MLPPPPVSRQASYAYTLPRPGRTASYGPLHGRTASVISAPRSDEDDGDFEERLAAEEDLEGVGGERGLEETLERLGFGAYHWRLLALCGFGWMSDNSALQCIAVILPRVQIHFDLTSKVVGLLSASTMAGMMIGAVAWGTVSDLLGRALPFNATLFLTAVFGIGASFSPSFTILCVWMFFLGTAVGGSMPTDGTLFLENLPYSKQYLLTLLSVFFSLGAVFSSVLSLVFLPGASCPQFENCDIKGNANDGWRKVLFWLSIFNLVCSFARWGLFRLHESPRYLVSNGRPQEAVVVLKAIAKYNNNIMNISSEDVHSGDAPASGDRPLIMKTKDKKDSELPSPATEGMDERRRLPETVGTAPDGSGSTTMYDSVSLGHAPVHGGKNPRHPIRQGSAFYVETPTDEDHENQFERSFMAARMGSTEVEEDEEAAGGDRNALLSPGLRKSSDPALGVHAPRHTGRSGLFSWWWPWMEQLGRLFVPQWRRTVLLMWVIWGAMSFAYTMFNVWLPAVLESRAKGDGDEAIRSALKEFVLYSIAGCPGSIAGAWMIQTRLGRRKSLAICTTATALSTFAFIGVSQDWAVVVSSMIISASATAMYAVLYGMTPETFGTNIRGTACGTSAALSRLAGVMAPITAGIFLSISPSLPLFVSAAVFLLTAGCSLALPFERVVEGRTMSFSH